MSIFIDSARYDEVQQAKEFGWVKGVTTNPTLLAQVGLPAEHILARLATIGLEHLFYQLTSQTFEGMLEEAQAARKIVGSALVLKVPPTTLGFRFVSKQSNAYSFCLTAIYSPTQAVIAADSGAKYVAVYVNRATRLLGDGLGLVKNINRVLAGSSTKILAASIKSSDEALAALEAGACHLTVPFQVLPLLTSHPLSDQTIEQFNREGIGLQLRDRS